METVDCAVLAIGVIPAAPAAVEVIFLLLRLPFPLLLIAVELFLVARLACWSCLIWWVAEDDLVVEPLVAGAA